METILKTRNYKAGYRVETVLHDGKEYGCDNFQTERAMTPTDEYIGNPKMAFSLFRKGIKPELAKPDNSICTIGFCEKDQKWYGWSHRAIAGFGIGSSVKKGDCAYHAGNKEEFQKRELDFWQDKDKENIGVREITNSDGILGVEVFWKYSNKIPNKKLHGTISAIFTPYPKTWGRGEWTAKTLEDAKQMAMDFAEGVG